MTKPAYHISSPEESAQCTRDCSLMGIDNWLNRKRFSAVMQFIPNYSKQKLLDFGCGNGLFLQHLHHNTALSLSGYDPYLLDSIVSGMLEKAKFYKSFDNIEGTFDIITALDVIEHIEDDEKSLFAINKLLNPSGRLLLIVPSHSWLYSMHDSISGHYRRYTMRSMQKLLESTDFTIVHQEYFFIFLIPVSILLKYYLAARKLMKKELHFNNLPSDPLGICSFMVKLENCLVRAGTKLPCGYCLLTYAQKR